MTLFPELVSSVLGESIIGRAQKAGFVSVHAHNIRDFANNKHNKVDDTPYGGGFGMLMMAPPVYDCYEFVKGQVVAELGENEKSKVIGETGFRVYRPNEKPELALLRGLVSGTALLIPREAFEDYGVFELIFGFVVMFMTLNNALIGMVHRFLCYELGKGNHRNVCLVFNISLIFFVSAALFYVFIAESAGLWFVCNKLNRYFCGKLTEL